MKTFTTPEATFNVAERDDYTLALSRDGREICLYRVIWKLDAIEAQVFVFAENKEGAISQATCGVNNGKRDSIWAHADRVPFRIRGWGTTAF